jgi:anti-anti-sigma regulatory factor
VLRIIETLTDGNVTIQLHGRLVADWLDELRLAIGKNSTATALRLDLTELRYADAAGVELLRSLRREGIEISSHSLYSRALLEESDGLG